MLDPIVLKTYRNRLTNLTGRNRSLLLTTLPAEQFIDLHDADFLLNRPSFDLITQLLSRRPTIPICDVMDARNERVNEVSKRLRRIARTAQFISEERGTDDLYVGWPFVRGKFMDGTVVHGPLLFFPVNLVQTGNRWQLTRRGDHQADASTSLLNTSFALAYGYFNQLKIGDDVLEKEFTDFDKDPLAFRTQLYEWLKTTPLELNFNPDLFTDQLQPFDRQTTKNLDALERTGELKLYAEAVLGIFPQAGSFLVPDYDALLERADSGETGFPFTHNATLPTPTRPIREEHLRTPLPLDASQEAAIRAVKAGESIVVQGPPGTGKSQLIANLMADAAAGGKRVLLVCQKRAALDVVYRRLFEVGMGSHVALIHDFQNDRPALYGQIAGQIADVDTFRTQNNSLDAVLLERSFDTESRRIDELVAELQSFKDALFDTSACGVSVKELYLSARLPAEPPAPTEPAVDLSAVYEQFRFDQIDGFRRKLADYAAYQQRLGDAHPFAERVSFSLFGASALSAAERAIADLAETARQTSAQTGPLFKHPLTVAALTRAHENSWVLTAFLDLAAGTDAEIRWQLARLLLLNPTHPAQTIDETELTRLADAWTDTLAAPGPELTLQTAELGAFRLVLTSATAARPSWVNWQWWQLTHPGKTALTRVLATNGLTTSEPDLQTLARRIDKRVALEAIREKVAPLLTLSPTLSNTPAGLRLLRQAREIASRIGDLDKLLGFTPVVWETFDGFAGAVRRTMTLAEAVQQQRAVWQTYLTDSQIEGVWAKPAAAQALSRSLRTDFDVLVETDRLKDSFSPVEAATVAKLAELPPAGWPGVFQRALCLHWIEHIEQRHPILRSVSSLRMAQMERALQDSVAEKQGLSRAILLVKLREQTYHNLTVNRLNNLVTYRELQHQTTKKRSIWPVRKLMSQFADEVFKLVPCWLASPESVSAMFPLVDNLFDLVIFDEASQCFAESGIPAMARGRQVVVAGDSQQLRPSDLYRIRFDSDAADADSEGNPLADHSAKLEAESLLELATQTLPQVGLTSHYRSRSPELIEFSNQHFYGHKLTLLPDFSSFSAAPGPAIRYHNVSGIWQQNTNPIEADAVVELVGRLVTELPGRSVGIVTFNYQQQQLIQEKLETLTQSPASGVSPGETTFVKNIENVQGDERDVIIFSVGYAADERGRLTMQFGSLNGRGGENRLNVAVTRARERIYVVTSLWPEQLSVEQSVNAGPKLLKAYLSYALDVAQGKFQPQPRPATALRSSALLKTRLAARHPDWQPVLPFADLTELQDGQYQSLILTDDDLYFGQTPKEAHAYLPFALRSRHWHFQRRWSREFWREELISW